MTDHRILTIVSAEELTQFTESVAARLHSFANKGLALLTVLQGGKPLADDLRQCLKVRKIDLIGCTATARSYTQTSKQTSPFMLQMPDAEILQKILRENRYLVIVDDIVDTGDTIGRVTYSLVNEHFFEPRRLGVVTAVKRYRNTKPISTLACLHSAYYYVRMGRSQFAINHWYAYALHSSRFIVGYGAGLDEQYRDLPYIGVLTNGP